MTTQDPTGEALGVTISSFCSVSLEPSLVLFCLGKSTSNLEAYTESGCFAVNVLAHNQADLSENFASQHEDKFRGIPFEEWESGCPILPGCVANLECTLVKTYDGGDHIILIGRVNRLQMSENGAPLLRYRGNYASLGATN